MKKSFVFKLTLCSIMAAMALALNALAITIGGVYQFNLYGIPLIFTGVFLGAKYGALTGLITGTVEQLISPYGISIESIFWAIAPILWGSVSGFIYKTLNEKELFKNKKWLVYLIVVLITAICANIANTIALTVSEYIKTKDISVTLFYFLTNVFARMITLPISIIINTIVSLFVCERLKENVLN